MSAFTLAKEADVGFRNAASYEKFRPSYPAEAVSKLLSHLGLADEKNAQIVDLACGTGKFTDLLVARLEEFEILAIEPHKEMRQALEEKKHARVKVLDGDAGNMPIEDGWADGLIAAQAWHWFATEESMKEIHRVLRPGAVFGMIWNIEDYNAPKAWPCTTKWEQKLKEIVAETDDGVPRFRHLKWREAFESQLDSTPLQTLRDTFTHNLPKFSLPLGEENVKWTVWLSDEGVWDRYSTLSQIAVLQGERREQVKRGLFQAIKGEDVERNEKGEVAVHGITHIVWTSRI